MTQQWLQWLSLHLVLFILVLTRLGMLLAAMPAVGRGVPMRIRGLLAITITALMLPTIATDNIGGEPLVSQLPPLNSLVDLAIAIGREALIGMLMGTTVQLLITGMQMAGELIGSTGGMQLGAINDPTSEGTFPVLSTLVGMLVTAVMLAIGGHRFMLDALLYSFQALPPGQMPDEDALLQLVVGQLSSGIVAGIRTAMPVVGALLLSNLLTGLISRTLPQINVLAIGLSLNALAMLAVTTIMIGIAGFVFEEQFGAATRGLMDWLNANDVSVADVR
ncbi:MAG: flagellar biosynthetic protein FliR [Planctomycetota bacterium]